MGKIPLNYVKGYKFLHKVKKYRKENNSAKLAELFGYSTSVVDAFINKDYVTSKPRALDDEATITFRFSNKMYIGFRCKFTVDNNLIRPNKIYCTISSEPIDIQGNSESHCLNKFEYKPSLRFILLLLDTLFKDVVPTTVYFHIDRLRMR